MAGSPQGVHPQEPAPASRLFPEPWTSVVVAATWVLLANSLHPATLVMAAIFGWLVPIVNHVFLPVAPRIHSWSALFAFMPRFLWDIVIANLSVSALILRFGHKPRSAWLSVPIDAHDPFAITAFAAVISLTPGTVSSLLSRDRRTLLVHALDADDASAAITEMKERYEVPLRRIFEP